jgi:hypothetical protein
MKVNVDRLIEANGADNNTITGSNYASGSLEGTVCLPETDT